MWTLQRAIEREWHLINHMQYGYNKWCNDRGVPVLFDIYFTPQGWFLASMGDYGYRQYYVLHLIDNDRYVQAYTITDEEFENHPGMTSGFFIPF